MKISKKKRSYFVLVFSILFNLFFYFSLISTIPSSVDVVVFIPGNIRTEMIILLFTPYITVSIIAWVFFPIMLKLFPKLAIKIKGNNYQLGIIDTEKLPIISNFKNRNKINMLFTLSIGLMIAQGFKFLGIELAQGSPAGSVITATSICIPFVSLIMPQIGWIDELGISMYRKPINDNYYPECIRVGEYLGLLLRGYASISAPISFIWIILDDIFILSNPVQLISMLLYPLACIGYFVPLEYIIMKRFNQARMKLVENSTFSKINFIVK